MKGNTIMIGDPRYPPNRKRYFNTKGWMCEIWKIYHKGKVIYKKDKTIDNCFKKYGMMTSRNYVDFSSIAGKIDYPVIIPRLGDIVDLDVTLDSESNTKYKNVRWRFLPTNSDEFLEDLKELYNTRKIRCGNLTWLFWQGYLKRGTVITINVEDGDTYGQINLNSMFRGFNRVID